MKSVTKLAIVGSRQFMDYDTLKATVLELFDLNTIQEIISGGARGADSLAVRFAQEFQLKLTTFLPDWKRYGRAASIIRNREIVHAADAVLAFSVNHSRGTRDVINYCTKIQKPLYAIHLTD